MDWAAEVGSLWLKGKVSTRVVWQYLELMSGKGHETAVVCDHCTKDRLSCSWLDERV